MSLSQKLLKPEEMIQMKKKKSSRLEIAMAPTRTLNSIISCKLSFPKSQSKHVFQVEWPLCPISQEISNYLSIIA